MKTNSFFRRMAVCLLVLGVVHHDLVPEFGVHPEQAERVGEAGVAVLAALLVEVEVVFLLLFFLPESVEDDLGG